MTIFSETLSILGPIMALVGLILFSFALAVGDPGGMVAGILFIPLGILVYRYSKYVDGEEENVEHKVNDEDGDSSSSGFS